MPKIGKKPPESQDSAPQTDPASAGLPRTLAPYRCHGVAFDWQAGAAEAIGDCPFCGKDGKLYIAAETGRWQCKVCSEGSDKGGGNVYTFLQLLWKKSEDRTSTGDYSQLKENRGLLYHETLMQWGVCKSIIAGTWLVPGFNSEKKLTQLYRYIKDQSDKWVLLATTGLSHGLHGANLYDTKRKDVYVCEGPWDGMALREILRCSKQGDGKLLLTGSEQISLLARANILAVPGCNAFNHEGKSSWISLLKDKRVFLLYDSDHPQNHNGLVSLPAGYKGMKRVAQLIGQEAEEIHYLNWGEGGYDPSVKSGYDIRDHLSQEGTPVKRLARLTEIISKLAPIPDDWIGGRTKAARGSGGTEIECLECHTWEHLVTAWRKAMKWIPGLDRGLSCSLASIATTKAVGNPLWFRIMGPPSCGKSTICEALSVNRKYIYPKDTMTGLLSGFQTDREGAENHSLVEKIRDKTLVIKDGDTVLNEPNLSKILSQFRAVYDRAIRSQYGNRMSTDHEGVDATVVLYGTSSLRLLDTSELGERFLSCIMMDQIDDDLEEEILMRIIHREESSMSLESNGDVNSRHEPAMLEAMQLTGGYISYLRENAQQLFAETLMTNHAKSKCLYFGRFVAFMRARPSSKQEEIVEREFGGRLAAQMARLAKALAVVLNRRTVDGEVIDRVRSVAMDTARGRTLQLAKHLYAAGIDGTSVAALSVYTMESEEKVGGLLRFLRQIGAAERFTTQVTAGVKSRPKWRLTAKLQKLYHHVMEND